jgi:hypothetical protein
VISDGNLTREGEVTLMYGTQAKDISGAAEFIDAAIDSDDACPEESVPLDREELHELGLWITRGDPRMCDKVVVSRRPNANDAPTTGRSDEVRARWAS